MRTKLFHGLAALGFVGAGFVAGAIGLAVGGPDRWYARLVKPAGNPPGWVFGPIWSTLYVLQGLSGYRVWRAGAKGALALWGAQLGLNALWTPLFFGAHAPRAALADLIALWSTLGAYTVSAWRVSRGAGALVLPYWAWVSYAGYLNAQITRLNPPQRKLASVL
ncbi:MAG TPA: TspO/MBR family protein [Oscillatoriaceae cyanobacterium]